MKKILFITTYYHLKNNSAAIRNNSLVKGLTELGCKVDVETVYWPADMVSDYFVRENNGHINYTPLKNIVFNATLKQKLTKRKNSRFLAFLKKRIKEIYFFPDICYPWKNCINVRDYKKYDLIISSSDLKSSHYVGLQIKKKYPELPWIQIWGDPWANDVNVSFYMRPVIRYMEGKLLKFADRIVYVSGPTAELMKKKHLACAMKMFFVPRGYYTEVLHRKKQPRKTCYRLVYTGAISYGRNINLLLSAIEEYNKQVSVPLELHMYGSFPEEFREQAKYFNCITLHGVIDYSEIPAVLEEADALLYLSNKKGTTQIPGKLYDYLGAGCPIYCLLYDVQDSVSAFLRKFDRCLLVENEKEKIQHSLPDFIELMTKDFQPLIQFSPQFIADSILKLL